MADNSNAPPLGEPNANSAIRGFIHSEQSRWKLGKFSGGGGQSGGGGASGGWGSDGSAGDAGSGPKRDTGNATQGAEPPSPPPPQDVQFQQVTATGTVKPAGDPNDMRAVLKVPPSYLVGPFEAIFGNYGGVLFPYTPQITLESKADYTTLNTLHSNYAIQFYKNSSVSDIAVTATFTVQNDRDSDYYVGVVRMLTALTKMKFGAEPNAGSPPPICRLFAYGEYILKNVPVAISSFRHDLPEDVDFYTTTSQFGVVSVPTKSQFTINLKPIYSRREMMGITVNDYLAHSGSIAGKGYL